MTWDVWRSPDERTRRAAARWFGRMQGPNAPSYQKAFEAWSADPRNKQAYDRLRQSWRDVGLLAGSPVAREARLRDVPAQRDFARWPAVLATAPVLLAAACLLISTGLNLSFDDAPSAVLRTSHGEIRSIALADGSHIILDAETRIGVWYGSRERRLRLIAGRARFDVAHEAKRPFIVDVATGRVIAHGTVFDVAIDGRKASVALLRGSIEVAPGPATAEEHARLLRPGQQVAFASAHVLPRSAQQSALALRWPDGVLEFTGTRLDDAVAAINKYNDVQLRISGASIAPLRVTGAFHGRDPAAFARAASAMFGLQMSVDRHGNLTLSR